MKLSKPFHEDFIQDLKTPGHSELYLEGSIELALEENDPKILLRAIDNIVEALGLSKETMKLMGSIYAKNEEAVKRK